MFRKNMGLCGSLTHFQSGSGIMFPGMGSDGSERKIEALTRIYRFQAEKIPGGMFLKNYMSYIYRLSFYISACFTYSIVRGAYPVGEDKRIPTLVDEDASSFFFVRRIFTSYSER